MASVPQARQLRERGQGRDIAADLSAAQVVIFKLLHTGVQTTKMQEHGLRHILLLKKAQLCHSPKHLFFSLSKRISILTPRDDFFLNDLQVRWHDVHTV
jgi:hypothetical protein